MDIHSGRKKIKSVKEMCQQRGAQNHMEAQRKTEAWIGLTSIIHLRKKQRWSLCKEVAIQEQLQYNGSSSPQNEKGNSADGPTGHSFILLATLPNTNASTEK